MTVYKSLPFLLLFAMSAAFAQQSKQPQNVSLRAALSMLSQESGSSITFVDDASFSNMVTYPLRGNTPDKLKFILSQTHHVREKLNGGGYMIKPSDDSAKELAKYDDLRGTVLNSKGEGVPFAHVYLEQTSIGDYTDESGSFALYHLLENEHYALVISAVGYESETIHVSVGSLSKPLRIQLKESFIELAPVEVSVGGYELADHLTPATYHISKKQIDFSPNLNQDIFRTISAMPSVANTDYSARPRLRGGSFTETAIYLDGFELIDPFHLDIGGGVEGLFNTEYISKVKVLPGSFSPRYTDKLSGVIDMETPSYVNEEELSFSLDLLNAIATGRVKFGEKWSYMGSIRRGYWDVLLDLESLGTTLSFYDSWNKLIFRPNDENVLEGNVIFGSDSFDYKNKTEGQTVMFYDSQFDRFYSWVNWKSYLSPKLYSRLTAGYQTLTNASSFQFESSISDSNVDDERFQLLSLNEYLEVDLASGHQISTGFEYRFFNNELLFEEERYDVHASQPGSTVSELIAVNAALNGHMYAGYLDYALEKAHGLKASLGFRVSGQSFTDGLVLAPRANVNYTIVDKLNVGLGYGLFYQPDNFYDSRSELGQNELSNQLAKASHYSASVSYTVNTSNVRLDAYWKDYHRLFDDFRYTPTQRIEVFNSFERAFGTVAGSALGCEISFNHSYKAHQFNIAYTYMRNRVENANGQETFRTLDVPHTVTVSNIWSFKNHFSLSAAFVLRSGFPYSEVASTSGISTKGGLLPVVFYEMTEETNQLRYSAYQSFDVKFSKSWYGQKTSWEAYLNVLNTFNASNVRNIYYDGFINDNGDINISRGESTFFPFFVTPGIKVTF